MVPVYVVSSDPYSGKTLTCLVLGARWQRAGLRVGYLKPLGMAPVTVNDEVTDEDVPFVAEQFHCEVPFSRLCPVMLGPHLCHADPRELRQLVQAAFTAGAEGQDVMLIGGLGSVLSCGSAFGLSAPSLAEMLDAQVVLVTRANSFLVMDDVASAHQVLGDRLVAVILNRVPAREREVIESKVIPCLQSRGVQVLGWLPDDTLLSSVSVREIARVTGGELLCGEEQSHQLVESFVVGAMGMESALRYFRQTARKCVITGGDRVDIQFAALETPTRCLILTGNLHPNHRVIARASDQKVPVLLVREDTLTTVSVVEELLGKQRIREQAKLDHARAQFEAHLDLAALDAALGLPTSSPVTREC
jgi:hypothetical protein